MIGSVYGGQQVSPLLSSTRDVLGIMKQEFAFEIFIGFCTTSLSAILLCLSAADWEKTRSSYHIFIDSDASFIWG
ncbi:hypothetical protein E2C01_056740 [Portunus trituberculatus]|uniref:Uncharacterized protein n=1 Tax=Portunus trituberculatus TaxID=210409 RepID=A0A5B7GR64_PORTR|nr:hypothetical protein [Portunus trituberculatus]